MKKSIATLILLFINHTYADKLASLFCEQENPTFAFSKATISHDSNSYWKIECSCNCSGDFFSTTYMRWNKGEKPIILLSVSDIRSSSISSSITNQLNDIVLYSREEDENGVLRIPLYDTLIYDGKKYVSKDPSRDYLLNPINSTDLPSKILKELSDVRVNSEQQQAYEHALSLFKIKKKLEAAQLLLQAIGSKPWLIDNKTITMYNDLGFFLQEANQYNDAINVLTEVVTFAPNRTPAYLNLADAYKGLNDSDNAKKQYLKYIELMKRDGKEKKIPARVLQYISGQN